MYSKFKIFSFTLEIPCTKLEYLANPLYVLSFHKKNVMFLVILTLSMYLTYGFEKIDLDENYVYPNFYNDTPYNIYDYVKELHLERCAIVGIGLKYFAVSWLFFSCFNFYME